MHEAIKEATGIQNANCSSCANLGSDGDKYGQPYARRETFMARLCARAGVKRFGMHAIRHLSASLMAKAGVDIPTIQAILRHKTPTTTARYLKQIGGIAPDLNRVFGEERTPQRKNVLAHGLAHAGGPMSIQITSRMSGNDEVVDVLVERRVYSVTLDAIDRELCASVKDRAQLVAQRVSGQVLREVDEAMRMEQ